ncbi:hypothetical protein TB2_018473 [Malus domestica]
MNPGYGNKNSQTAFHANTSSTALTWLLDTGASSHMTNSYTNFQSPESYNGPEQFYIGDNKGLPITHSGSSSLHTSTHTFDLNYMLHVPDLKQDLISTNQFIVDNWCSIHLYPFHFIVKNLTSGKELFEGLVKVGLYPFLALSIARNHHAYVTSTKASQGIWHQRLSYPSFKILNKLASKSSISLLDMINKFVCSSYALGKCSRKSFTFVSCNTSKPLEILHIDVWGPASISSVNGYRYYLLLVDDFTKYSWFFPLKYKSEVFSTFIHFKSVVENMLGFKVITVRSDFGGEFVNHNFSNFFKTHGISHQLRCPHTPEQNGCAERKHRYIVETARTILATSQVPHIYWVETFSIALYLINGMPTGGKPSPWELLFHKPPDYTTLKVFGCRCFPWLKPYTSSKLDLKSKPCVFLGYSLNHKGYRCLDAPDM